MLTTILKSWQALYDIVFNKVETFNAYEINKAIIK